MEIKMKNLTSLCLLFVSAIFSSCSQNAADSKESLVCLDLEKNLSFKNSKNLNPEDLKIIQLERCDSDLDLNKSRILDIAGDTVFLLNNDLIPTKILMFSLQNGKYLGDINHQGEGQGEYRFIYNAFVDKKKQTVLIPDIDRPFVYEYSLISDSLVNTFNRPDITLRLQPIGNIKTGINLGVPKEEGLTILQCNSKFEVSDSLLLKGIRIYPFMTLWEQSGTNGIIFDRDTLSIIGNEELAPLATLNLGKYNLKEKEAREIYEGMIYSDEPDSEYLKRLNNYIIIKDFQFTDDKILITSTYGDNNYSDVYNIHTGEILNRFVSGKDFNGLGKIELINQDGAPLIAEKLFTKDNIWYGISNTKGIPESKNEISIINFRM